MSLSPKGVIAGVVALVLCYALWQSIAVALGRNVEPQSSSALLMIDFLSFIPFLAFVVSGFLAARVAAASGLLHGLIVAVAGSGLFYWHSIARLLSGGYQAPVHVFFMSVIAAILAGGVGELYARRKKA